MRGSEIGLQAVLLHSPLAFVVLDGVALCPRRVDDKVHLLIQDDVQNVGAAFGDLVHHFALHAGLLVELGGTFVREEGTCGFLALVVSEGVVVGEAEDFDYDDRSAYASLPPKGRHAHISAKVLSGQRSPSTTR